MAGLVFRHKSYNVRHWTAEDRETAGSVVRRCLEAYGLDFEPEGADLDALQVEDHYLKDGRGEFWVVVDDISGKLIGTAGYYEVEDKDKRSVEIRKMYLLPEARGEKLGRALLQRLEGVIAGKGYERIIVETAGVLFEACQLYESAGYRPLGGVETERCDRRLYKNIQSES